jgi:hypothetical protein
MLLIYQKNRKVETNSVANVPSFNQEVKDLKEQIKNALGADIAVFNGVATREIPVPATFVLDRQAISIRKKSSA